MKTSVYLIRHGNINCADKVPGRMSGLHLSSRGYEQAIEVVNYFKDQDLSAIYSSPLERVIETAEPIAREKKLAIAVNSSFTEVDFGEWTGKSFSELENDFRWKQFHFFRNGCQIPDGELMIEVQVRMVREIEFLKKKHEGKSFAVFSHNDPIKSVIAFYAGISLDLFLRLSIDTGSISKITFENEFAEINMVNNCNTVQVQ